MSVLQGPLSLVYVYDPHLFPGHAHQRLSSLSTISNGTSFWIGRWHDVISPPVFDVVVNFPPLTTLSVPIMQREIRNLNPSKATQKSDVPTKLIKENEDIFSEYLTRCFNNTVDTAKFPNEFKLANVTPVHKKGSKHEKENLRPVSVLPDISKLFEKCLYSQMSTFFDNILSKFQYGFRKDYSAQQ